MIVWLCFICLVSTSSSPHAREPELLTDPHVSPFVSGVLEIPGGTGPYPAVILLHGAGGWDERYPRLAKLFADSGFVALALDYYANAGYAPIGSDDKIEKWPAYQAAVQNAVEYIGTLPAVVGRPVGLVGFSRGAFLAVSVASSLESVKAVVDFFGGGVAAPSRLNRRFGVSPRC